MSAPRILILDGAFGTMAQALGLGVDAYVLDGCAAPGCHDLLCLTAPEAVVGTHRRYLEAGANIIETNSFSANAISLADYGLEHRAYDLARASATLARKAIASMPSDGTVRMVAGSMGPTSHSLTISPDINDPAYRDVTFEQMRSAYAEQARGLVDGGADLILIETVFDTLNAKAAIMGVRDASTDIPIIVSGTFSDASGRTLSGQTVEAFFASLRHAGLWAISLNCGFGAPHLLPYARRLAEIADCKVMAYPNAGLPDATGCYTETPADFASHMEAYFKDGILDIAGGCCGTTPSHIAALAEVAKKYAPRGEKPLLNSQPLTLAGLEPLKVTPETNFINIGERANVAGSAKFARLIREGDYQQAISIAREQVMAGAQIVDVCMDAALIDAPQAMRRFLNMVAGEPDIARVPIMIDSSDWTTIEAGLQCTQGKSIVNSINLKEGEEEFLRRARILRSYGAAAVVMLFDEEGQAGTYERKIAVAERAYRLLTADGFPAEDIIFDPNILAIATGMPEHDRYALDFIRATKWIKENLPGAKVSGGVSNLSFSFRGNNDVRKAMHSAFLYHAIAAGMDMAIVNPQMVVMYDDIESSLLEAVEDALLCRRPDAADRLMEKAKEIAERDADSDNDTDNDNDHDTDNDHDNDNDRVPIEAKIASALTKGESQIIGDLALEALEAESAPEGDARSRAIAVIDDMLMPAMERIGLLFGEGKMFLPQVVKSARAMKAAVDALQPYLQAGDEAATKGTVVIATVKGDVHDIGKNIVGLVLGCNGFRVVDLGVMQPAETIIETAKKENAIAIGLSGLITPSLAEMAKVAKEAERQGLRVPIIIGGATTSPLHTALKIATEGTMPVVHSRDAADTARIASALVGKNSAEFVKENAEEQQRLRIEHRGLSAEARGLSAELNTQHSTLNTQNSTLKTQNSILNTQYSTHNTQHSTLKTQNSTPHPVGCPCCGGKTAEMADEASVNSLLPYINWASFFAAWGIPGKLPEIFDHPEKGEEARKLYADAQEMLKTLENKLKIKGLQEKRKAIADGDDIIVNAAVGELRLAMARTPRGICGADYVREESEVVIFVFSAGIGLKDICEGYRAAGDDYSAFMAKLLADRLVEAYAEKTLPGGCRIAFGYPMAPDHALKKAVFDALRVEERLPLQLTETFMINPAESICGIWLPQGTLD